ncbi:hypothetical protein ABZU94_31910, partial [Streptomyces mirabilis]
GEKAAFGRCAVVERTLGDADGVRRVPAAFKAAAPPPATSGCDPHHGFTLQRNLTHPQINSEQAEMNHAEY